MKAISKNWIAAAGALATCAALRGLVWTIEAQTVPQPVLMITNIGSNQFSITISNGVTNAYYEIYHTPMLGNSAYPWTLQIEGAIGQTSFSVNMGMMLSGFFRADYGLDPDGDGIQNFEDGNPYDPGVGALTITIDSPANGTVFN